MSITLSNVEERQDLVDELYFDDADESSNPHSQSHFQRQIQLESDVAGMRIDQVVALQWSEFSREKLKQWIKDGKLLVNGQQVKPKYLCKGDEILQLDVVLAVQNQHLPEDIPLNIIYEDDDILVINKPVGLVVHPGAGNPTGTLLNALLHHHPKASELDRAGIVHRIDKDTSGLLVVAKNLEAQYALSKQLADKTVYRLYDLIVYGEVIAGGTIDKPIKRHPTDRVRMSVQPDGKPAVTHYHVKERFAQFTRLHAQLETGRTHQIRVHFSYLGYPLVGDAIYMQRKRVPAKISEQLKQMLNTFNRQALHAYQLGLVHPRTGEQMRFEAPLPEDFTALLEILRVEQT